jgi:hypothetical protein
MFIYPLLSTSYPHDSFFAKIAVYAPFTRNHFNRSPNQKVFERVTFLPVQFFPPIRANPLCVSHSPQQIRSGRQLLRRRSNEEQSPTTPDTMDNSCVNDGSFGPAVQGCRGDFDFTQKFEQVVLSLIPTAVFLLLFCALVYRLAGRPRLVSGPYFQCTKMVSTLLLVDNCKHRRVACGSKDTLTTRSRVSMSRSQSPFTPQRSSPCLSSSAWPMSRHREGLVSRVKASHSQLAWS